VPPAGTPLAGNNTAGVPAELAGGQAEHLLVKQFHCRIHVALLDACYNAVLAHQELVEQGMTAGPFPMFPMEKLVEGYRHR
jgi:hypothetical protein